MGEYPALSEDDIRLIAAQVHRANPAITTLVAGDLFTTPTHDHSEPMI